MSDVLLFGDSCEVIAEDYPPRLTKSEGEVLGDGFAHELAA